MKFTWTLLFLFITVGMQAQQRKLILDADTGNEVDDPYAIVRALIEPTWEVTALQAAQWQSSQWATAQTMEDSHRLNMVIVSYLDLGQEVPTLRGGIRRMNDWGDKAQHSAAAYEIISQAKALPDGEQLEVVVLGALTNVASALWIDPSIEEDLVVYWLGLSYDFGKHSHKRIDFNAVMDPQATELLLASKVEMHIIPSNVASAMKFDYGECYRNFREVHPLTDFLLERWTNHVDGSRYHRTIWDLGLVSAMIHPKWASEVKGEGFENPNIWLYEKIDAKSIINEFYTTTLNHVKTLEGY